MPFLGELGLPTPNMNRVEHCGCTASAPSPRCSKKDGGPDVLGAGASDQVLGTVEQGPSQGSVKPSAHCFGRRKGGKDEKHRRLPSTLNICDRAPFQLSFLGHGTSPKHAKKSKMSHSLGPGLGPEAVTPWVTRIDPDRA